LVFGEPAELAAGVQRCLRSGIGHHLRERKACAGTRAALLCRRGLSGNESAQRVIPLRRMRTLARIGVRRAM